MDEISTYSKVGVTLIVIASILLTVFSIFVTMQTFSRNVYEEQARTVNVTESELQDIVNTYLPVLALDRAINASKYGGSRVVCDVSVPSYINGVRTVNASTNKVAWEEVLKENTGNVGCVRAITYDLARDTLTLQLELGG